MAAAEGKAVPGMGAKEPMYCARGRAAAIRGALAQQRAQLSRPR